MWWNAQPNSRFETPRLTPAEIARAWDVMAQVIQERREDNKEQR